MLGNSSESKEVDLQLTREEINLSERAQAQGYVTSDGRDEFEPVVIAYQTWCRATRQPFLHIVLGDATSKVILSLLEADTSFRPKTEQQLRKRIPTYCLSHAEIEIEPDYVIVGWGLNDLLPEFQDWLLELSNQVIYRSTSARDANHNQVIFRLPKSNRNGNPRSPLWRKSFRSGSL